jgi:hypothetical protein
MYVYTAIKHVVVCGRSPTYLSTVGVERGLCVVCRYRLGVEVQCIVPFLVPEGIVAQVLELGRFLWRRHDVYDVWLECGTGWGMRGTRIR